MNWFRHLRLNLWNLWTIVQNLQCGSLEIVSLCGHTRIPSKRADHSLGYLLLGMISTVVFRTIRNAVPKDPQLQERLVGSLLFCLAVADVSGISNKSTSTCILTSNHVLSSSYPSKVGLGFWAFVLTLSKYLHFTPWHWWRTEVSSCCLERHHPWQHHVYYVLILDQVRAALK